MLVILATVIVRVILISRFFFVSRTEIREISVSRKFHVKRQFGYVKRHNYLVLDICQVCDHFIIVFAFGVLIRDAQNRITVQPQLLLIMDPRSPILNLCSWIHDPRFQETSCNYFFHWVGQPASVKGVLSPSEANAAFCAKGKTSTNREKTEVVDYQNQTTTPFVQFLYVWCIELSNTCTWRGSNVIEETIFLNKLWSGQFDCIFDRPYHGFGSHLDEQATA